MPIVVESVATAAPGGGATTTVCDKPTGTAEGDLLVALVGGAFASGTPDVTLSGWTRRAWRVTTTMFFAVLTKVAGGSEPTSYTFNNGLSASTRRAAIMRVSGADPTTPFDGTPSTNDGSGTTITGTGITTGEDNSLVCLAGNWSANSTTFTPAEGSGLVSMNRIGVAGAVQSSAGATGNKTATISNGPWIGVVFAIMDATPSNTPPTVVPDTADEADLDTTPTLAFTGTDDQADPITYRLQISGASSFENPAPLLNVPEIPNGIIHPNPSATVGWDGNYQIDDRPGQCVHIDENGILDSFMIRFNKDANTNGNAYIKVYPFDETTTYGSTGAPEGEVTYPNSPIPNPLAISDAYFIDTSDSLGMADRTLTFSGANRIVLEAGKKYVFIVDWWPANSTYDNTITIQIDANNNHAGNMYQDGNGSASINHGAQATWDLLFQLNQETEIFTYNSDTDSGFENVDTPADTDPFISGDQISFTSPEIHEGTWYWRVQGKDPDGSNAFGAWSVPRSFTATAPSAPPLGVGSTYHVQAVDDIAVVQIHNTAAASTYHSQTVSGVAIVQHHVLGSASTYHAQAVDAVAATQTHVVGVASTYHSQTTNDAPVAQTHNIGAASTYHTQVVDDVAVSSAGSAELEIASTYHVQAVDDIAISQTHVLSVASTAHGQVVDGLAVAQRHVVAITSSHQEQFVDGVTVTQTHNVGVASTYHTQAVDDVGVVSAGTIGIASTYQSQAVNGVAIVQHHQTGVGSTYHEQVVDDVAIATEAPSLAVASTYQSQVVNGVAITQHHQVTISSAYQLQVVDDVTIVQHHQVTVSGAYQEQFVDDVAIGIGAFVVAGANTYLGQFVGGVAIAQTHNIAARSTYQIQVALGVRVSAYEPEPGEKPIRPTSYRRIFESEVRRVHISKRRRTIHG